ncbi:MAG TPA: GDP-mannose 4,6-dehydratase [Mucilaginibacter sp.]|jgi:GDPmannose 4,6-dehydratase|nr:GDP-mannose 4,6-dehydratase [Mucilaginibacter sp.]
MKGAVTAIIFGHNGQDGQYLCRLLSQKDIKVVGISRSGNDVIGNVSDYELVKSQIEQLQPQYIFHLAAKSTTHHSALFENHHTICTGTLNILEAVRLYSPETKIFLSGSAMQFKNEGLPIDEQTPFEASSAYSVARIQSVYAARYYREKFHLKVYMGYFFNHDSPYRTEHHVNQKIAQAVVRIVGGSTEKLELGNIDVKKEFNYAGDMVEAIWLLVNQNLIFEAIIGSGDAYSIKQWLQYCFTKVNKNWHDYVVIKDGFVPEYSTLVSNPEKLKSLGWEAKTSFTQLADMMIEQAPQ